MSIDAPARTVGYHRGVVGRAVLLPLLLLLGYALAFGTATLGMSPVIAFDDHPGQLYRLWHVLHRGFAPWAWNPGWWAGYPELQFYPPGFAYLGALLHYSSFGIATAPTAYHALVWVAYLAPALTAFACLRHLLGDGWSALPGAFVTLTVSAGVASGVEGGVHWGMVAARLAWALLPLLILAVSGWAEGRGRFPLLAVPLLAIMALTHPAHVPTALVIILLAASAQREDRRTRLMSAVLALGLAAALTAFWSLPLLLRLDHSRALAWGTLLGGPAAALTRPLPLALIGCAVLALRPSGNPRPHTAALVARLPWVAALVVVADVLLVEPLGLRWLPADRVADGAWMALLLAAGLGIGGVIQRLARGRVPLPVASLTAILVSAVLSLAGHTLTLWPRAADWPTSGSVERGYRLSALWTSLRAAPEGHVLITRSSLPLVHGNEWYRPHTHATALAPLEAGRRIVHGTFTHPSPIAALVYRGHAGGGAITQLAEQLDGHVLFGRAVTELDPGTFNRIADRLGICTVVVLDEDIALRQAMEANPELERRPSSPPFLVYGRRGSCPLPTQVGRDRWRVTLDGDDAGWVSAHIAFYPLWRAAQGGKPIPVRRGALGELEVRLARAGHPVDLTYRPSSIEWAGLGISIAAALSWLALLVARARSRHRLRIRSGSP